MSFCLLALPAPVVTVIISFILILAAAASIAIGRLITGKNKFVRSGCGRAPGQSDDESCEDSGGCSLCSKPEDSSKTSNK